MDVMCNSSIHLIVLDTCDTPVDRDVNANRNILLGGLQTQARLGADETMVQEPFIEESWPVYACSMMKGDCLRSLYT